MPGGVELGEEVFVKVTLHVLVLARNPHVILILNSALTICWAKEPPRAAERLDEREDPLLDIAQGLVPAATAWVSAQLINSVVAAITRP